MGSKRLLKWINSYQRKGGSEKFFATECNFDPTCSEYTKQIISKYGVMTGIILGIKRIRRCNDSDLVQKIKDPAP